MPELNQTASALPADDLQRHLTVSKLNDDASLPHLGVVGDTYTITVSGQDTNGRFCIIDMHIPPGGGPAPHRHDFDETFVLLDGELEVTFRGVSSVVTMGTTVNIPSNAPHRFHNVSQKDVRLLCICAPAGLDEFFKEIGVPVATRTAEPPPLNAEQMQQFIVRAREAGPRYKTELLRNA